MNQRSTFILLAFMVMQSMSALGQNPSSRFKMGDVAPDFNGKDQFNNVFTLSDQLKEGPVVLMFYRGHWCPYCNKQLSQLEDSLNFILDRGGTVVAVTPEQPNYIQKTVKKTGASFKILHDRDLNIMNLYGVSFEMKEALVEEYKNLGLFVEEANGINGHHLPVPATYIIHTDGRILYAFYDPNYEKRATVKKILQNL